MDGLGHSDNTAVTCLEVEGERTRIVFENDNSHLPDEISTLARQRWWKEPGWNKRRCKPVVPAPQPEKGGDGVPDGPA